jgi:hypothetical protein
MRAAGAGPQQRQEQRGQQKPGEVIDREAQLEPVGALLASAAGRADAGVVDQDVEPVGRVPYGGGKPAHLGQARQIGPEECRRASRFLDLGDHPGASLGVAAMHQDARPGAPEAAGDNPADAVGRAGDERRLSGQLRQSVTPFRTVRPARRATASAGWPS